MIGIIGAMAEEVTALKQRMVIDEESVIHDIHFMIGSLQNRPVVLMQGGIGKVNASYATTLLLEHFAIDYLINIGSAGGLLASENVGDVVIAQTVAHHDVDCESFGYAYGTVPGMPNGFTSDDKLIAATVTVLKDLGIPHHMGLIVSGDQFVARLDQVAQIQNHFPQAIAVEMEAAAVSQVAYLYHVPFIILRSLSDVFGKGESGIQFDTYLALASEHSAQLCEKVVGMLE